MTFTKNPDGWTRCLSSFGFTLSISAKRGQYRVTISDDSGQTFTGEGVTLDQAFDRAISIMANLSYSPSGGQGSPGDALVASL